MKNERRPKDNFTCPRIYLKIGCSKIDFGYSKNYASNQGDYTSFYKALNAAHWSWVHGSLSKRYSTTVRPAG